MFYGGARLFVDWRRRDLQKCYFYCLYFSLLGAMDSAYSSSIMHSVGFYSRNVYANQFAFKRDGQFDLLPIRNDWIYLTVSIVLLPVDGNNLPCVDSNQWSTVDAFYTHTHTQSRRN